MSEINVVIVDDEAPARQLLKEYLSHHPQLRLQAECKNGIEALGVLNALRPDLVFMDVQMPGKNGLEVVQELEELPAIIFSTAYDQYALQAFEANALDYLLKPYTRERFDKAVRKALGQLQEPPRPLMAFAEQTQAKTYPDRILVEQGNKLLALPVADISLVEASGDYTYLHTDGKKYLSTKGLGALEQRLKPGVFLRVHRSYLINVNHVTEVVKDAGGPILKMAGGMEVRVSRSYLDAFREIFM